jgi:threonine dehydrogenase-like Zn-dependent dehydrogenase
MAVASGAPPRGVSRIAVLGAGHVGPLIAQVAVAGGFHVTIAASGGPERIALIAPDTDLGSRATVGSRCRRGV